MRDTAPDSPTAFNPPTAPRPQTVIVAGATGTIGAATTHALIAAGHRTHCLVRAHKATLPEAAKQHVVDLADSSDLARVLSDIGPANAVISCLASRTGAPSDAWTVDHDLQSKLLNAIENAGTSHFVLLSAICVQRPKLAFQKAKLAFEARLKDSSVTHSIVRPTAYFKSLSGQIARLRAGRPFLLFGDGTLTACKPISDRDLAAYLMRCVTDPELHNRTLPIGGPGPAETPRQNGEALFAALDLPPKFRKVPVALMDTIIGVLSLLGRIHPGMADKAELARIGRYYATQSMLVFDPTTGEYNAEATPETGADTLADHYAALAATGASADLGAHAVF